MRGAVVHGGRPGAGSNARTTYIKTETYLEWKPLAAPTMPVILEQAIVTIRSL